MNPINYFMEFNKKGAKYEQKGRITLRERGGEFKKMIKVMVPLQA